MSDVIALIFDFDDTLASDSTSGFLDSIGVDTASFWKEEVDPLLFQQDWDPVPAYLYKMIELSRQGRHGLITQQRLKDWGARLDLHDGVAVALGGIDERLRGGEEGREFGIVPIRTCAERFLDVDQQQGGSRHARFRRRDLSG